jgi:hypothetical protein
VSGCDWVRDKRVQSGATIYVLLPEATNSSYVEMSLIAVAPFCDRIYPNFL